MNKKTSVKDPHFVKRSGNDTSYINKTTISCMHENAKTRYCCFAFMQNTQKKDLLFMKI